MRKPPPTLHYVQVLDGKLDIDIKLLGRFLLTRCRCCMCVCVYVEIFL